MDDPLLVPVPEPELVPDRVLDTVEPLPLAPVVATAPASIESTSVMGMKVISVPDNTVVVALVVMAVLDVVATSVAVSRKNSGPMNVCAHVAAVVPSRTQSITAVTSSAISANSA